jgi:hypothetical protein
MSLGSQHAGWRKLQEVLVDLASKCGAPCAFVVDEGNGLWCVGAKDVSTAREGEQVADTFYRDVIAPRAKGLRRGERIDLVKADGDDRFVALSFAGIYVATVWYGKVPIQLVARARLKAALPTIEAIVLALPPHGGPDATEGAKRA